MISVIIAEDHRLVAEGIAKLIDESSTAKVVAITGTLSEAATLLAIHNPQLLLLDVAMPDGDGIDAITPLLKAHPELKVIILTSYAEPSVIHRAMDGGASGYILKSTDARELLHGINEVHSGNTYICQEARQLLIGSEVAPALTNREREILRLIVNGLTIKEVASKLNLGFETVHSYTKSIRQKLGCSNMSSLVRVAMERHLV